MAGDSPKRPHNRYQRFLKMIRTAYISWGAIVGTVLASIALTSLIIRLLAVPISEAFIWLLMAYKQTFYPPIVFLLSWLPFMIPDLVKDAIVIYIAGAGILHRTLGFGKPNLKISKAMKPDSSFYIDFSKEKELNYSRSLEDLGDFKKVKWYNSFIWKTQLFYSRIYVTLMWPKYIIYLFKKPHYIITTDGKINGVLPATSRDIAENFIRECMPEAQINCTQIELIITYTFTLLAVVISLLISNLAFNQLIL